MSAAMPRFMPILTSFAGRVAGCGPEDLLSSGAVLARALRDAQKVAGHDGVLCLFEPGLLAGCCIEEGGAPRLVEPDTVVAAPAFQVLADAVGALGAQVPANVSTIFTLAGPALLRRELQARCPDAPELDDWDYVSDVLTAALGAAFDSPARGFALVDSFDGVPDADLTAMYRSARKLADFYERPFVLFLLPGSAAAELPGGPQCIFALPQGGDPCALLRAVSFDGGGVREAPATTAGDIPADTPVAAVRDLCREAMQRPAPAGAPALSAPGST